MAVQRSHDEDLGVYWVISAESISLGDLLRIGRFLGIVDG